MHNLIFSIFSKWLLSSGHSYFSVFLDSAHWLIVVQEHAQPKSKIKKTTTPKQNTQFHAFKIPPKQFSLHLALFTSLLPMTLL